MPSFLNAIEDKLTAIEDFICDKAELESYSLGSFTNPTTLTLEASTRFIKISVTAFPDGISKRFGRVEGQPNNYPFGFIAFESDLGLAPEINWEWIDSYFYPEQENNPNKIHIYTNYPNTSFAVTGFKVKQS
ncbi:hypothetical protein Syn7502_02674 [Synechococcus sp. PCC 7502]|nr:hypothetical protein Syn7502_02674 [Synechococcus sp. PCC 7502]